VLDDPGIHFPGLKLLSKNACFPNYRITAAKTQEQIEPIGHVTRCGKIGIDYEEYFLTKNIVHHKKKSTQQMSPLSILHMY
jgi:hypothetical protein